MKRLEEDRDQVGESRLSFFQCFFSDDSSCVMKPAVDQQTSGPFLVEQVFATQPRPRQVGDFDGFCRSHELRFRTSQPITSHWNHWISPSEESIEHQVLHPWLTSCDLQVLHSLSLELTELRVLLPAGPLKTHRLISCSLHVNVMDKLWQFKCRRCRNLMDFVYQELRWRAFPYGYISEKQLPWVSETPICFRSSCHYATRDFANGIGPCTQHLAESHPCCVPWAWAPNCQRKILWRRWSPGKPSSAILRPSSAIQNVPNPVLCLVKRGSKLELKFEWTPGNEHQWTQVAIPQEKGLLSYIVFQNRPLARVILDLLYGFYEGFFPTQYEQCVFLCEKRTV